MGKVKRDLIEKYSEWFVVKFFPVSSPHVFLISFAIIFVQRFIPSPHITGDSKDAVKLGAGILAFNFAYGLPLLLIIQKNAA
ncbi:MAG: hypothetical protein WCG66_00710 [bacterium]